MALSRFWDKFLAFCEERAELARKKVTALVKAAGLGPDAPWRRRSFLPQVEELRERILPSVTAVNDFMTVKIGGTINQLPLLNNDLSDGEDAPEIVLMNGEDDFDNPIMLSSGGSLIFDDEADTWEYQAPSWTVTSSTVDHIVEEIEYEISDGEDTSLATATILVANGQWANSLVCATVSTYDSGSQDWSAVQALGEPNTNAYGDYATAWAAEEMNGGLQTITLGIPGAFRATGFLIRENNGNGFVSKVELYQNSSFTTVFEANSENPDTAETDTAADFTKFIGRTDYNVSQIRITVDTDYNEDTWEEIDAVRVFGWSTVDPTNHGPTVHDGFSVETNEDTSVNVDALVSATAYDQDGDPLFLTVVTPPEHGSVAVNDNDTPNDLSDDYFVYTPDPNYNGSDSFEFALVDIHGAPSTGIVSSTNPGLVSITVDAVNDDPVAIDDYAVADQNAASATEIHVLENDFDAEEDSLGSLSLSDGPYHGTASVDGDDILYWPGEDYVGDDEIVYEISDGNGGVATASVWIHVYPEGKWASSLITAVSSEYGNSDEVEDWSAIKALGPPDTNEYGDIVTAWAPELTDSGWQTITVGFDGEPGPATGILIRETNGNGFVKEIYLHHTGGWEQVWSATDVDETEQGSPGEFLLTWTQTLYDVDYVKIVVDTDFAVDDWEEIDAIRLLTGDYQQENMMMRMQGEGGGPSEPARTLKTRTDLGHGKSKETTYDAQSRPVLEITTQHGDMIEQRELSYDSEEGFLAAIVETDAIGRQTQCTYDSAGRTLSKTLAYGTEGAATTSYEYDENGNLISLTDPDDNTTSWQYDENGREILMTDPLGRTVAKTYDEDGRLASIRDRDGRLRTFTYDDDGHLTQEVWYAGATTASAVVDTLNFSFNDDGTLASASNGEGEYDYTYNDAGQLTDVSEPFGVSLHFGYDAAGHRNLVQDSFGGEIDSTYNDDGQLASRVYHQTDQPTLRIDFQYDSQGRIKKQLRYSDAAGTQLVATTDYSYDGAGHLIGQVDKKANGDVIASYAWDYDVAGQLISQSDHGVEKDYTYDDQGQLTGDGTIDYSYDLNGNRDGENDDVGDGNRLNSDGTWEYSYNLEGNVTKKSQGEHADTWVYGYDNKNAMTSAALWNEDPDEVGTAWMLGKVEFKYDVFGNRVQKRVDTDGDGDYDTTQRYALDGWDTEKPDPIGNENWDVWADLDGSSSLTTRYLRGDIVDQLFARVDENGAAWLLTDHLGSVRDVVSNSTSPTILDTIAYDAFGNATPANSTADATYGGRYKWTGREFDVETGLQYNRARYYDAATGRWLSQDPMGFDAGDSNLYRYVNNAPTNMTDPNGLQAEVPTVFRKSPFGVWSITQDNKVTEQGKAKAYHPNTWIEFEAFHDKVSSSSLTFIQIAHATDKDGKAFFSTQKMSYRRTKDDWAIDQKDDFKYGWYLYLNSGETDPDSGYNGNSTFKEANVPALMFDMPIWPTIGDPKVTYEFQVFLVDKDNNGGKVLSGLSWGFSVNDKGSITSSKNELIDNYDELKACVDAWNKQSDSLVLYNHVKQVKFKDLKYPPKW